MVNVRNIRKSICEIARYLIMNDLTDLSGGNISVRDNNKVYVNERFSGPRYQWLIEEDQIIVTDICKMPLIGDVNMITREASTHYAIYQAFPDINAVIHCHPIFMMTFGAAHMNIPPIGEGARVIFEGLPITNIEESVPSSQEQAERVVENFKKRREKNPKAGLICNIPFHGVFSAGKDINEALLFVDTANTCARLITYRQIMFGNNPKADLSIHKEFTKEEFATMNIFKEVCKPGYIYTDPFGNEAVYKGFQESNKDEDKKLKFDGKNYKKIVETVTKSVLEKLKNKY